MRILLTSVAHERYWSRLARPGLDALTIDRDGTPLLADGTPANGDIGELEVAWATSDLYLPGAPRRAFFEFMSGCSTIRWFQSGGAGFDAPIFAALAHRGVRTCFRPNTYRRSCRHAGMQRSTMLC